MYCSFNNDLAHGYKPKVEITKAAAYNEDVMIRFGLVRVDLKPDEYDDLKAAIQDFDRQEDISCA